ncbi:probable imidazolonepropionase [Lineus longissimus]|uniref:probable imidazolonepropionase n=1 Tax=Lineus longissimus TaxID=88925 RepID=UPI002B4F5C71
MAYRLLIHSAKQVVFVAKNGEKVLVGDGQKVAIMESEGIDGISIVIDKEGNIKEIGEDTEMQKKYSPEEFDQTIDATGLCILPGLVDGHTHPVWDGDRVHEFAMKLAGATYMDVHKAGGGINFTVERTKAATEEQLFTSFRERLDRMLAAGTTLVECKSGYGLNLETELKMLRVIERAKHDLPIDVSSTYCGAHSVPKGYTASEATDDIINVQIPHLKALIDGGELSVDNIDVFCEKGVFDVDQSRKILVAGKKIGLNINFHGEELNLLNSAQMGAEIGAMAISHLEEVSDDGIDAMAKAGCVATILPTTAYILRLKQPPVRKMIERGVPVALGTDFNPNAFCLSLPLVMHLACVNLHMTMDEALIGATLNAAASLGKATTHGSIEVGKVGDFVILDAPRWEHLIYQMAGHDHIIKYVVKNGKIVKERK